MGIRTGTVTGGSSASEDFLADGTKVTIVVTNTGAAAITDIDVARSVNGTDYAVDYDVSATGMGAGETKLLKVPDVIPHSYLRVTLKANTTTTYQVNWAGNEG